MGGPQKFFGLNGGGADSHLVVEGPTLKTAGVAWARVEDRSLGSVQAET
jgi:hypothetical protein